MPNATQPPAVKQDALKEFEIPKDELSEFITEMQGKIASDTFTRQFAFNRAKNNYQMYRGMIGRPLSDIPYEGSSDIRYRLSTLYIRQTRNSFAGAVLNAPKLVRFTPKFGKAPVNFKQANESADKQEAFSETVYRDLVKDFHNTVDYAFSKLAIDGRCVAKVVWNIETALVTEERDRQEFVDLIVQNQVAKYKMFMAKVQTSGQQPTPADIKQADLTDDEIEKIVCDHLGWNEDTERYDERIASVLKQIKSDEEFIEIITDKVIHNGPVICITNYEDVVVPDDTTRIDEAEWIAHKLRFSKRALRAKSVKNGGQYHGVEDVLDDELQSPRDQEQRQMDSARRKSEGLQDKPESKDNLQVTELYCWVKRSWIKRFNKMTDSSPDLTVRAVITFLAHTKPETAPTILRGMELPYHHQKWPFVDFFYNQTDKRFYENEGIVGLLWPLEIEHNVARNAAINRTTLAMSPPGFFMEESGFQPQSHRQLGQMHAIDDQAYIASSGSPAKFMEYPDLSRMPDYDANNARSWASEIVGVPNMASVSGYQTAPTAEQINQVVTPANMIQQHEIANWLDRWGAVFTMIHELNKQYLFLAGTTQYGFVNREQGQTSNITKADFDPEFLVTAGGDPSTESPVLLTQKRALIMQQAIHNPALAPFIELYEGWRSYVSHMLPVNEAMAWIPPREKAEEVNQMFIQMAAQAKAKLDSGKRPPRQQKDSMLQGAMAQIRPR